MCVWGGGVQVNQMYSCNGKMLTFRSHLHVPQRKIYGSIITGSTSEVVPPVKIKCLRKPVLGATTGPATGVNDFPIETEKCLSSKDGNSTEERTRTGENALHPTLQRITVSIAKFV